MQAVPINNSPAKELFTMDQGDRIERRLDQLHTELTELRAAIYTEEGARPFRDREIVELKDEVSALSSELRRLKRIVHTKLAEARGMSRSLKWLASLGGGSGLLAGAYQLWSVIAAAGGG
jgi:hypothetical protein